MDPSTDLPAIAETTHTTHCTTHHITLDQISEAIADTKITTTIKTDRASTGTTIGAEGTNRTTGTTRGMGFRTGMTITGSTTEDDQTNTNTTKANQKHKPKPNGINANIKKLHHIHESTPNK